MVKLQDTKKNPKKGRAYYHIFGNKEFSCLLSRVQGLVIKSGYDLELTNKISQSVNIPVIASGGAGNIQDLVDVFKKGNADAALAASIFHYKTYSIRYVKKYLQSNGLEVRK